MHNSVKAFATAMVSARSGFLCIDSVAFVAGYIATISYHQCMQHQTALTSLVSIGLHATIWQAFTDLLPIASRLPPLLPCIGDFAFVSILLPEALTVLERGLQLDCARSYLTDAAQRTACSAVAKYSLENYPFKSCTNSCLVVMLLSTKLSLLIACVRPSQFTLPSSISHPADSLCLS